jgi:hypothetical protein
VAEWTKKQEREALAAVCSLKRALGIPDHKNKPDAIVDEKLHVYTGDIESAQLIGELLFRYGNGKRAAFYDAHPEKLTLRDTIRVEAVHGGGFDASMNVYHSSHFARMILKMVDKHIAPDGRLTR